ncbi:MAG TPA: hypothetical protein VFA18_12560 [Gemmataceae bacterium]|nr:hypothetical protein [Gemmataceae bacterium]
MNHTRRDFLADVGRGMLIASVGPTLVADLGLGTLRADEPPATLNFGPLEPLVALMQETAPEQLLPRAVEKLRNGTDLKTLLAAAALANARTFGGEDYVGFHTMMALAPAYHMAGEMPVESRPLPVLKVMYRNAKRIQEKGGRKSEVLHPVISSSQPDANGQALLEAVRRKDMQAAERTFAALAGQGGAEEALNQLLLTVQDAQEVHRVVLPYRAWDLLPIIGKDHAQVLLRQSVHYCVVNESPRYREIFSNARELLPKLLDQHHLPRKESGTRKADDAWVAKLSQTIFQGSPEDAAGAVAEALAEGFTSHDVAEAISLAANQLVLRDNGRPPNQTAPNKPVGSVHGDGIGVHACDSANAWRNLARVSNARNRVACLILSAHQVARDRTNRGGDFLNWQPYPRGDAPKITATEPDALLREAEAAIKDKDQARACAVVHAYGQLGHPARPVFDLLLRYAVSEDGALHGEKYYRTVSEEFAATRPAFRWRQLVALARVTASEYGQPAEGHEEACRLLKA